MTQYYRTGSHFYPTYYPYIIPHVIPHMIPYCPYIIPWLSHDYPVLPHINPTSVAWTSEDIPFTTPASCRGCRNVRPARWIAATSPICWSKTKGLQGGLQGPWRSPSSMEVYWRVTNNISGISKNRQEIVGIEHQTVRRWDSVVPARKNRIANPNRLWGKRVIPTQRPP